MAWTNFTKVYHGTTEPNAINILKSGPNPAFGRAAADFGQGFYVTTDVSQAKQWANQKVRSLPSRTPNAAVVEFTFDRNFIASSSKYFSHIAFVKDNTDYQDFVQINRLGSTNHGRGNDILSNPLPPYDVIYGPLSAFPQTLSFHNCDQICFTSITALGSLNMNLQQSLMLGNPYF